MFAHNPFEIAPPNFDTLIEFIDAYSSKQDLVSKQVLELLKETKMFYLKTAYNNSDDRAIWSQQEKLDVFSRVAAGLINYSSTRGNNNDPAYQYCVRCISERLKVLELNKDVMFDCYQSNDNALKSLLVAQHLNKFTHLAK